MQGTKSVIGLAEGTMERILRALEHRVTRIASLSYINALLTQADPSLVLPSPALALMRMTSDVSADLPETVAFRSLDPVGLEGDAIFTPIEPKTSVHPWIVKNTRWIPHDRRQTDQNTVAGRSAIAGCVMTLGLPADTHGSTGWIYLWVDLGQETHFLLNHANVSCGPLPVNMRLASPPVSVNSLITTGPAPIHFNLESLYRNLAQIEISHEIVNDRELEISLFFDRPVPAALLPPVPKLISNVIPVWNSLRHRYPEFTQVEQHVTGRTNQRVFPLCTRDLGRNWRAWIADQIVSGSNTTGSHLNRGSQAAADQESHRCILAFLPDRNDGSVDIHGSFEKMSTSVLSVILPDDSSDTIENNYSHVRIQFQTTTGGAANDLPSGTSFEAVDLSGMPQQSILRGMLVGKSWGGSDGVMPHLVSGLEVDSVLALTSAPQRSVGDVLVVLNRHYGHCFSLVDEYDLVRSDRGDYSTSLVVRVQFRDSRWSEWEKQAVLRSASMFLNHYTAGHAKQHIRLVEE